MQRREAPVALYGKSPTRHSEQLASLSFARTFAQCVSSQTVIVHLSCVIGVLISMMSHVWGRRYVRGESTRPRYSFHRARPSWHGIMLLGYAAHLFMHHKYIYRLITNSTHVNKFAECVHTLRMCTPGVDERSGRPYWELQSAGICPAQHGATAYWRLWGSADTD